MNPPDSLRFLSALFAPYQSKGATVDVRCLQSGRGGGAFDFYRNLSQLEEAACYAHEQAELGFDVYCGVLPRFRTDDGHVEGSAAFVEEAAFLWVDVDGGTAGPVGARDLLASAIADSGNEFPYIPIPPPTILVASGGGVHAYWQLRRPVPCKTRDEQEAIRKVLRRLVRLIGGDASGAHADKVSAEPARILRIPGTFNYKPLEEKDAAGKIIRVTPRSRPVRLLRCETEPETRSLSWWMRALPPEPVCVPPARPSEGKYLHWRGGRDKGDFPPATDWHALPPSVRTKIEQGARQGERHPTMQTVATACRKYGLDDAAIRDAVETLARNSNVDTSDYREVRHIEQLVEWTMNNVQPDYSNTGGGSYNG